MATVSSHHALSSLAGATRQGHTRADLLKVVGINPQLASRPDARINDNQMTALVQLIWERLGDEFMGFTETPCKRGAFSFMLHAVRRCHDLREALRMGMRFYNLFTDDIRTELTEADDRATITIRFRRPELDDQHFYQDFWMVIWHRLASWLCGIPIPLIETAFAQSRPPHAAELMTMFPGEHRFEATANQLVFAPAYLDSPLIRDKAEVDEFLVRSPYNLLTIPGHDRSLKTRVAGLVTTSPAGSLEFPPLREVARRLHMSQQTLHRRLRDEDSSYQKIKDGIRRDLALNLLIQEQRPVYAVAEAVGFADARSFTRAFKHWTGMTPREYCRFL
ncbi:AraC family transcriptional regulator [Parahaliea mediterranea]|uniref:AraC family transcriptional regulator n=1 Tax=Parahaliea mediterranea TaxID=651086 RepID=A0A939IKJ2_9GAMM|nr:AraC family transcriptional regulator [Parahaliea mediterranea]MBN7794988.1 AraC family transcriptional regulator [Parahaliea mediterranea]